MKKTLAIVLALVMVLCMIPAMGAESTTIKTVTDKQYNLKVESVGSCEDKNGNTIAGSSASATKTNSITFEYNFEEELADETGRFTADTKMALVTIEGLDDGVYGTVTDVAITVDGKVLDADKYFNKTQGKLSFPVELTKAGYSDTYLVQISAKAGDTVTTETAKVSVKFVNKAAYKDAKAATITNIVNDGGADASIYIVGSKLYIDYVGGKALTTAKITFANENGKAFSEITYVDNPLLKSLDYKNADPSLISVQGGKEVKLDKSAAEFDFAAAADGETIKFELETKNAWYETKTYTVKMRTNIKEEDPKGIYFAEPSKTIAMGETYAPVVLGVATGKAVAAKIDVTKAVDKQVLDVVDDYTVIGTREGVAYITASYQPKGGTTYTASSMKITVTLPGESIPAVGTEATVYYVTCRNLNVRAGAGTSYKKTGMVHRGDAVKVVEIKNGWAKLADNTYVCAKYIAK